MDGHIQVNKAHVAVITIPASSSGDTVTYIVYKASDGSQFATGNATFIADEMWKVSFTPDAEDTYIVKLNDTTITSKSERVYKAIGAAITTPAAPDDGDLTTLARFKQQFNIITDAHDNLLDMLISQESYWIKKYTGRDLVETTYNSDSRDTLYDGDNNDEIMVRQYPIISVTSVKDDTAYEFASSSLIDSSDYLVDKENGIIQLKSTTFAKGKRNVQIYYSAGYATLPADIEMACQQRVMAAYLEDTTTVNAKPGDEVIYKPSKLRSASMRVIDLYRRLSSL